MWKTIVQLDLHLRKPVKSSFSHPQLSMYRKKVTFSWKDYINIEEQTSKHITWRPLSLAQYNDYKCLYTWLTGRLVILLLVKTVTNRKDISKFKCHTIVT